MNDNDFLQGYFDDLLRPDPASAEALHRKPKQRQSTPPEPQTQCSTLLPERRFAEPSDHSRTDAQRLAREKLAKLLTTAPPLVENEKPARVTTCLKQTETRIDMVAPAPAEIPAQISTSSQDSLAWQENGRPAWAQQRFEVLLFEVSGLTLAVPLVALGQIQPLNAELTPLFGQADWFMGLQPTPMGKISTVNTALFVMPERYSDSFLKSARYVISIHGLPWGLAVCRVNQPISMDPEEVVWRSDRSKRPWLAGTVKQHMCALLDVETMGRILQESDVNAKK